jgi:hypothetical protein
LKSESVLIDEFIAALASSPGVSAHLRAREVPVGKNERIDALVEANVAGRQLLMLVELKETAYPRDVRDAVWQLRTYQAHNPIAGQTQEVVPFIVAEAISPGARETLRSNGVGYFDRGGSLYVPTPGAFIFIDKPPPKSKARVLGSIFMGRKAQVLKALFLRRGEWVSVKDIAASEGISPAPVSQTLTDLERQDWVDVRGSGPGKLRRLVDSAGLLDAWARFLLVQKPRPQRRYFVSAGDKDFLLRRLAQSCEAHHATYAVTGEAAAQAYSPYLTSISQVLCRMLVGEPTNAVLEDLQARAVNEGWNLAVIESRSSGDFTHIEKIEGICFASPLQVYLDLLQGQGRAKEMGEHLRREKLRA